MKILAIGLNYRDHAEEYGSPIPKVPFLFNKATSSLIGDGEAIVLPKLSTFVDYEAELTVVIGSRAKNITKEKAFDCIRGYTIANDVTARDIQQDGDPSKFFISKSFDTFCPLGPRTVSKEDIDDPHSLAISLHVNGEKRQVSNTSNLIFKIDELVSWISRRITLKEGDVILTGTPGGVGHKMNPPTPLKAGDIIEITIEGIGILKNPVIAENV